MGAFKRLDTQLEEIYTRLARLENQVGENIDKEGNYISDEIAGIKLAIKWAYMHINEEQIRAEEEYFKATSGYSGE